MSQSETLETPVGDHSDAGDEHARQRAHRWVELFRRAWKDADTESLLEVVHPHASVLYPPMEEPVDREGLRQYFAAGLGAVPDFRIRLVRWGMHGDDVFIEWRGEGTVRGERVSWGGSDRFTFQGDSIVEARAYFDPRPMLDALALAAQGQSAPAKGAR